MHVIRARNVAHALPMGVAYLQSEGVREESRAGPVLVAPGPVTTVYERPRERVLKSAIRDANPFFHLAEIAWMLCGRDDAEFLNNFVADFGQRFAESASGKQNWEQSGRVHGAYGKRWREELELDQLDTVVDMLRHSPTTRQAVIQMWDARPRRARLMKLDGREFVLTTGCNDLRGQWQDRPCNTHVYLRVRDKEIYKSPSYGDDSVSLEHQPVLDITVCCRSNDIVWGAYGANAVHFSSLQEYLAARVGVGVGTYYQISNNFHMYESERERLWKRAYDKGHRRTLAEALETEIKNYIEPQPLVDDPVLFDSELRIVVKMYEEHAQEGEIKLSNKFLGQTLYPALTAHRLWKSAAKHSAMERVKTIASEDWRAACWEWMDRRKK